MIFGPTKGSNSCKLIVHNIILADQKIEWSVNLWLCSHAMFKVAWFSYFCWSIGCHFKCFVDMLDVFNLNFVKSHGNII